MWIYITIAHIKLEHCIHTVTILMSYSRKPQCAHFKEMSTFILIWSSYTSLSYLTFPSFVLLICSSNNIRCVKCSLSGWDDFVPYMWFNSDAINHCSQVRDENKKRNVENVLHFGDHFTVFSIPEWVSTILKLSKCIYLFDFIMAWQPLKSVCWKATHKSWWTIALESI